MIRAEAERFLNRLHRGLEDGWGTLTAWLLKRAAGGTPRVVYWDKPRQIQPAALRWLDDVYVSVCTFCGGRRASLASRAPGLWADIDPPKDLSPEDLLAWQGQTYERLVAFMPSPSLVVFSGRGWQAEWLFHEPVNLDFESPRRGHLAALVVLGNKALQRRLDGDSVADLARCMRVPGTVNTKTGARCQLVREDGPTYDFRALLGLLGVCESDVRPPAHHRRPSAPKDIAQFEPVPTAPRRRGRPRIGVRKVDLTTLPEWAGRLIVGGVWAGRDRYRKPGGLDRSRADMAAVGAMVRAGWTNNQILAAFEREDWLIGTRYRELRQVSGLTRAQDYLGRTVARAHRNANRQRSEHENQP